MEQYGKYICTTLERGHLPGPTPSQRDQLTAKGKRIPLEHVQWISTGVIPGSYYGEVTWIWPPDYPGQVRWEDLAAEGFPTPTNMPLHSHSFPELLSWWGTNPDDFADTDPMGLQMANEIIRLDRSWVVYVPAGVPHLPIFRMGARSQIFTRPTLHWTTGLGDMYTMDEDDNESNTDDQRQCAPDVREVDPGDSAFARYVAFGTSPSVKRPGYLRTLDPRYARPMVYIDQTVIPDAELGCDTMWLLPGDTSKTGQVIMDAHTLPHGTSITCSALNYEEITDLCAEVELWIGGEKHIVDQAFWAYIPPNVSQGPIIIRNITKQVFWMMSWPLGDGIISYPGGK